MNHPSAPIVHIVRANILENTVTWRLGPVGLECEDSSSPDRCLPYGEIGSLRISYRPSRFDSARYRCEVNPTAGGMLTILSTHYVGIGDFEDRAATYSPLVRELIARVAAANRNARFFCGKKPLVYFLEHAFLLAMLAFLAVVLALIGEMGLTSLTWVKLAILVTCIPVAINYARKNWPRSFSPAAIPPDVLPLA